MSRWIENLRQKLTSGSIRFFSAPYLPLGLIWAAVLLVFTDSILILLGQPAGFWITHNRAESGLPWLKSLLAAGLGWYALAGLVYLGLICLGLILITRSAALVIWLTICFVHLNHSILWLAGKILGPTLVENSLELILINAITGLILGMILVFMLLRPGAATPPGRLFLRLQKGLPVAWVLILIGLVLFRALLPKGGWQQIKPAHSPGYRASPSLAYDPVRSRAVLFGGYGGWIGSGFMFKNDTWEWDGHDWQEMKSEHSPSPRVGGSMAYDEKHGVMVLFGGEDKSGTYMLDDTWLWDGKDWKAVFPENIPSARRGAQMFFDDETGKLMLSGGFNLSRSDTGDINKNPDPYGDTWTWDGENWQYVSSMDQPMTVTNSTVTYDPIRKRAVVFDVTRMLVWEAGSWQTASPIGFPQQRFGPAVAINPGTGKILFFGGLADGKQLNDTWSLDGNTWKKLNPDLAPSPRDAHVMFYDPIRKSFIVYGGESLYSLDDMWEYVVP